MADKDADILRDAQDHLTRTESAESTNRKSWSGDVKFARLGEQWPPDIRRQREGERRPCLTINKLGPVIRQVVNDARQNRPSIKVLPQDDKADIETAEVITGLIRNIEQTSDADVAYDTAIDGAVSGGFGYWRINLDYANDVSLDEIDKLGTEVFEQDICIKRIMNPLSVYGDPDSTQADSSDWMRCLVTDKISETKFKKKYPDAKVSSFDDPQWSSCPDGWKADKTVTIAEYWVREEQNVLLIAVRMPDTEGMPGEPVVMRADEWKKQRKEIEALGGQAITEPRAVKSYKVTQHVVTGLEVLETKPWPGTYIPIVPVYGDEVIVDGKRYLRSLIADARGPQEQYNFWSTAGTELVALAPRAPFIGRKGAFDSDPNWSNINNASLAFVEFDGPERPTREPPPSVSAGDLRLALNASDDIKAVTGIYDASLGARSNETSGVAITARQREGDVSTFHFIDNLTRAIRHTGRVIIDLIPKVYSTPRIIRILGEDGTPDSKPINQQYQTPPQAQPGQQPMQPGQQEAQPNPEMEAIMRMHDFRVGRYDLAVTSGPSFTTKREEAAQQMIELIRAYPAAAPVIGDLLAKNLDWPGADEIAERLKSVMDQQMGQGQQQQPPDPSAMAKVQVDGAKVQVEQFKAETDRMAAQTQAQTATTPQEIEQIVIRTLEKLMGQQQLAA